MKLLYSICFGCLLCSHLLAQSNKKDKDIGFYALAGAAYNPSFKPTARNFFGSSVGAGIYFNEIALVGGEFNYWVALDKQKNLQYGLGWSISTRFNMFCDYIGVTDTRFACYFYLSFMDMNFYGDRYLVATNTPVRVYSNQLVKTSEYYFAAGLGCSAQLKNGFLLLFDFNYYESFPRKKKMIPKDFLCFQLGVGYLF